MKKIVIKQLYSKVPLRPLQEVKLWDHRKYFIFSLLLRRKAAEFTACLPESTLDNIDCPQWTPILLRTAPHPPPKKGGHFGGDPKENIRCTQMGSASQVLHPMADQLLFVRSSHPHLQKLLDLSSMQLWLYALPALYTFTNSHSAWDPIQNWPKILPISDLVNLCSKRFPITHPTFQ